jgi:hypothetical protein
VAACRFSKGFGADLGNVPNNRKKRISFAVIQKLVENSKASGVSRFKSD